MKNLKGVFLSDVHMPENINLKPIFKYLEDLKPEMIILGGDILDAKDMHGIDSFKVTQFNKSWYERDVKLLKDFLEKIYGIVPKAKIIYLEGNHEERYSRIMRKYPDTFKGDFDFARDAKPAGMDLKWIPYGGYNSFYRLGDSIFLHGTIYPDSHSKRYALDHTPYKCFYGHLHHFQAYTTRKSLATMSPRYAVTCGCLSETTPEWKKGAPNQWINGFMSFTMTGKTVIPTVHLIEKGKFYVGACEYKGV